MAELDLTTSLVTIDMTGSGLRGESQADILRRTGQYGVLPSDTDEQAMAKLNAFATAEADRAEAARDVAQAAVGVDYANLTAAQAGAVNGDKFTYWDGEDIIFATKTGGTVVELTGVWFGATRVGARVMTLAEAKAATINGPVVLSDRGFSRWVPSTIFSIPTPTEMQDYTWFEDASATKYILQPNTIVDPRYFGAVGGNADLDTRAFHAMAWWCGMGYSKHVDLGNVQYLIKDGLLAWYPAGTLKDQIVAINGVQTNTGVTWVGCNNLLITNGRVKVADNGCSINSFAFTSWSPVFNWVNSSGWRMVNVEVDSNRAGQLHTSGGGTTRINFGIHVWGNCDDWVIFMCRLARSGTLRASADKGGDDIYIKAGARNWAVDACTFVDCGRWNITMEKPSPTSGDDIDTRHYNGRISNCTFDNPFSQDGGVALGAIDVEPWSAYGFITIEKCLHKGNAKISCGSAPNSDAQVIRGLSIRGITYDLRGSINPHTSDDLIGIAGAWTNSFTGNPAVRRFEGLTIDNIIVYSDKALGGDILQLTNCVIADGSTIRRIRNLSTGKAGSGILWSGAWMEGTVIIEDNDFGRCTHGVYFNSFTNPTGTAPAHIILRRNVSDSVDWGFRGTLPALPSGSTFTVDAGNRFVNQAARTDLVASAFVAAGGVATLRRGSFFSGASNVFTGFTIPGQGSATVLSGQTFVTVTHDLGSTPSHVLVTPRVAQGIGYGVTNIGSTTFRITMASAAATDIAFDWMCGSIHSMN